VTRRRVVEACLLFTVALTIGCDQVSKRVAATHLMGVPPQSFLGDTVRLEYAENAGAFLSLGADLPAWARTALFTVGTGIIVVLCAFAALRKAWVGLPQLGFALVMAGGVSNLADRIQHGAVVDFLNVGIGSLRTGIFNVADMAIMAGVAFLLLSRIAPDRGARRPTHGGPSSG
jgi:signal peptidase II